MTTLAFLIARASHLLNRGLYAHARGHGLSPAEGRVLAALAKDDGRNMTELAASLLIKQSTLTRIVDRLESAQLVTRVTAKDDRRLTLVILTEHGWQLAAPMTDHARRQRQAVLRGLGRAGAQELETALTRLIAVLEAWAPTTQEPEEHTGASVATDVRKASEFTILFVDDESDIRDSIAALLASRGFRVLAAPAAGEALQLLQEHHIDALFTDIVMPDVNGLELAREARRRRPDLKVLFMTGYSGLADEAERLGPLLYKPARSTQIEFELRKLLAA
jgi:DNA-binding MarR family transcriptional regulator/CheY-like chemotaxis protein